MSVNKTKGTKVELFITLVGMILKLTLVPVLAAGRCRKGVKEITDLKGFTIEFADDDRQMKA